MKQLTLEELLRKYPVGEVCYRVVHRWDRREHFAAVSKLKWGDMRKIGESVFFDYKEAKEQVIRDIGRQRLEREAAEAESKGAEVRNERT